MKNKETLETLITKWQKRQIEYQDISVNNSDNEHTSKKFTYKAVATRDCWKELLEFTSQEKVYSEEEVYNKLHNLMTEIKLNSLVINDDMDLKQWFNENKKK